MSDRIAYNLAEAAELVGVKYHTLKAAIDRGELKARRSGGTEDRPAGKYLVTPQALTEWFEGLVSA